MIDHVSVPVKDLSRAARFYEAVLGALGYATLETRPATIAFGKKYSEFWINLQTRYDLKLAQRSLSPETAKRIVAQRVA